MDVDPISNDLTSLATSFPAGLPISVLGNEADPPKDFDFQMTTPFVYVGTAGLMNLSWIGLMTRGSPNVPKLYIVDYSTTACSLWAIIKEVSEGSDCLEAFKEEIGKLATTVTLLNGHEMNIKEVVIGVDQFLRHKKTYEQFRYMMQGAKILTSDWRNPNVFSTIAKVEKDLPRVLYASNILEFIGNNRDKFKRGIELSEGETGVSRILTNIQQLKPCLTIHARTSLQRYEALDGGLRPDLYVFHDQSHDLEAQQKSLSDSRFGSLDLHSIQAEQKKLEI